MEDLIPVESLLVLDGELGVRKVSILKDDGCNTDVVSRDFAHRNAHLFDLMQCSIPVSHSKKDTSELATQVIVRRNLQIGTHQYLSNWAVADCRYDVSLGMPWYIQAKPEVDYSLPRITVDGESLPQMPVKVRNGEVQVTNLGVKKFRSLLRKRGSQEDFCVYQVAQTNNFLASGVGKESKGNKKLDDLLSKYSTVFRHELPSGLPPKISVDHAIELEDGARPPKNPLIQLSPAELMVVKEYVVDLLKKGKIRRSKSPFGASLFLVKEPGKLRAVVDYRGLNRITKRNSTPLPRCDEMFDR